MWEGSCWCWWCAGYPHPRETWAGFLAQFKGVGHAIRLLGVVSGRGCCALQPWRGERETRGGRGAERGGSALLLLFFVLSVFFFYSTTFANNINWMLFITAADTAVDPELMMTRAKGCPGLVSIRTMTSTVMVSVESFLIALNVP